ncbi:MAG: hypothetical protein C5B44_02550 [Acidobacteria bacterium]|nr:MAG: hypothetical protein C5B44_02550 [Acidobacteriota bacterium]
MQKAAEINLSTWRDSRRLVRTNAKWFAAAFALCAGLSAVFASWLPLQLSIVSLFLFAGPHNWFEFRYFLSRLPLRFGRSRPFFLIAFSGIGLLTASYLALPLLYNLSFWPGGDWSIALAIWNTSMLLWIAVLVHLRGRQKRTGYWSLAFPVAFLLVSINWMGPQLFSLLIVYVHPLIALWFLDRHLRRTRPEWLATYRRGLCILPLLILGMYWQLNTAAPIADDNGLFWRITQHAGSELLPNVSSHLLVSVHVFLEMLHYGVWIVALTVIGGANRFWQIKSIPLARHERGFPRLIAAMLAVALIAVILLWVGFAMDYPATRDLYFSIAMAHVLAEAPFLMRML